MNSKRKIKSCGFSLFYNYLPKRIRFLRSHDTLSLFLHTLRQRKLFERKFVCFVVCFVVVFLVLIFFGGQGVGVGFVYDMYAYIKEIYWDPRRKNNTNYKKTCEITYHPLTNLGQTLDSTDSVDFTHFKRTVNRYCGYYFIFLEIWSNLPNETVKNKHDDISFLFYKWIVHA